MSFFGPIVKARCFVSSILFDITRATIFKGNLAVMVWLCALWTLLKGRPKAPFWQEWHKSCASMTFGATMKYGSTWKMRWKNTTPFCQSGNLCFFKRVVLDRNLLTRNDSHCFFSTRRQEENCDHCSTENTDQLSFQIANRRYELFKLSADASLDVR